MTASLPVAQVRALVQLLFPEEMTPTAKRMILSACEAAEDRELASCPHTFWNFRVDGTTVCRACGVDTTDMEAMGG